MRLIDSKTQMYKTSDKQITNRKKAIEIEFEIFYKIVSKLLTEKGVLKYNNLKEIISIMFTHRDTFKKELTNIFQDEIEENLHGVLFSKVHEDDRKVLGNVIYKHRVTINFLLYTIDR